MRNGPSQHAGLVVHAWRCDGRLYEATRVIRSTLGAPTPTISSRLRRLAGASRYRLCYRGAEAPLYAFIRAGRLNGLLQMPVPGAMPRDVRYRAYRSAQR